MTIHSPSSVSFALLAALATVSLSPSSFAQELVPGKPAPALAIAKWVKGAPVAELKKEHVYVVEFWATWCGPCIAGMPHLSDVQKKHQGALTVIGVTSEDDHNSLADVEAMVKEKGETMAYTVAWDDAGKTQKAWFEAAGQEGIPCSFVVDKAGLVAWIGHPQWLDVVLPDVLAGKADPKALADKITAVETRMKRVFLLGALKPEKAIAEAETLIAEFPFLGDQVENGLFSLLLEADDLKHAWAFGAKLVAKAIAAKDVGTLNSVAWSIVDPEEDHKERNLELAMQAASKAVELTERKQPHVLDTLARVHACKGEWPQAIAVQKEALALLPADEAEGREAYAAVLQEYETKAKAAGK